MLTGTEFLVYVMFWTIVAIMLVILVVLKKVNHTQYHIQNIDRNVEKMVHKILLEEERILEDLEGNHRKTSKKKTK